MFMSRIARRQEHLEEILEWIIVPLTQSFFLSAEKRDIFKEAIIKGKAINSKALICLWTTVDKQIEERQAEQRTEWITELQ